MWPSDRCPSSPDWLNFCSGFRVLVRKCWLCCNRITQIKIYWRIKQIQFELKRERQI
jgi:hypothetical protein